MARSIVADAGSQALFAAELMLPSAISWRPSDSSIERVAGCLCCARYNIHHLPEDLGDGIL